MEIPPHEVEHLDQDRIPNGIKNLIAHLAIAEDLPVPQNGEVLRNVRLFDAEPFLQSTGGKLAVAKQFDDGDSRRMRQCLEDAGFVRPQEVLHLSKHIRFYAYTQI